eukprot:CAMPEP_0195537142 /NCGR_PEP_ID=MMETSP0794_2-20130614/47425_1 /TAXON_ID=515487 /ORGANISM="Stephanopyxis turris, Strain CCMP 815" /LENGTH=377 /DNA_ID=CAMNT_0040670789 /DNA_START=358 /DNA_END=1491 /DNA_ORIENTATION=+
MNTWDTNFAKCKIPQSMEGLPDKLWTIVSKNMEVDRIKSQQKRLKRGNTVEQEHNHKKKKRRNSSPSHKKHKIEPCGINSPSHTLSNPTPIHWVRRSVREPNKSIVNAPVVINLCAKLRCNDPDMVVLKMKKYIAGMDTPAAVIDKILDALSENQNCQALYIQNYNEGMRSSQLLKLLSILKLHPNLWCLNIGETYQVSRRTWEKFTKGLKKTKVTHMYASEHVISADLKDKMRHYIRRNRKKHGLHCDVQNLEVITQCTHCWWNPINAKVLLPFIKAAGHEHLLGSALLKGSILPEEEAVEQQQQQLRLTLPNSKQNGTFTSVSTHERNGEEQTQLHKHINTNNSMENGNQQEIHTKSNPHASASSSYAVSVYAGQ